jgi:hypothetical protein
MLWKALFLFLLHNKASSTVGIACPWWLDIWLYARQASAPLPVTMSAYYNYFNIGNSSYIVTPVCFGNLACLQPKDIILNHAGIDHLTCNEAGSY